MAHVKLPPDMPVTVGDGVLSDSMFTVITITSLGEFVLAEIMPLVPPLSVARCKPAVSRVGVAAHAADAVSQHARTSHLSTNAL